MADWQKIDKNSSLIFAVRFISNKEVTSRLGKYWSRSDKLSKSTLCIDFICGKPWVDKRDLISR